MIVYIFLKISELNLKNQLELLNKAITEKRSYRSLTLLINKANETATELKESTQNMLKENPYPSSALSVKERQSNPFPCAQENKDEVKSSTTMDNLANHSQEFVMTSPSEQTYLPAS